MYVFADTAQCRDGFGNCVVSPSGLSERHLSCDRGPGLSHFCRYHCINGCKMGGTIWLHNFSLTKKIKKSRLNIQKTLCIFINSKHVEKEKLRVEIKINDCHKHTGIGRLDFFSGAVVLPFMSTYILKKYFRNLYMCLMLRLNELWAKQTAKKTVQRVK